jgi:hypothetical protein
MPGEDIASFVPVVEVGAWQAMRAQTVSAVAAAIAAARILKLIDIEKTAIFFCVTIP